jgi:hypothetical protein
MNKSEKDLYQQNEVCINCLENKQLQQYNVTSEIDENKFEKEICDKYEEFKRILYIDMIGIIGNFKDYDEGGNNNKIKYDEKELVDKYILLEFRNLIKPVRISKNLSIHGTYLKELDEHIHEYFINGIGFFVAELQKYKERATIIMGNANNSDILYKNRKLIVENEVNSIENNSENGKCISLFKFILNLSQYFLICYYHELNMNYEIITYIETCYIALMLMEHIFGVLNTYLMIKNSKIFVERNFANILVFENDIGKDNQILEITNNKNEIDLIFADLF